jgi:membrane-associated phospholipid phosphatase
VYDSYRGIPVKKIVVVVIMIVQGISVFAESRYTYDLKKDLVIGSVSLGVFAAPFFIDSPAGNNPYDIDAIDRLDRRLMFPYDKTIDTGSSIGAYGLLVLPAISLVGNIKDMNAVATYGIMYAEAFLLTWGTKDLLKKAINRNRPYLYFDSAPQDRKDDYKDSFPSGHTALAFMSAAFLTNTFWTEYPGNGWRFPVAGISYALAAGVAVSRVLSGSHFLTDVIVGAAIGSLYGSLVPALHERKKTRGNVTFTPAANGFFVSLKI